MKRMPDFLLNGSRPNKIRDQSQALVTMPSLNYLTLFSFEINQQEEILTHAMQLRRVEKKDHNYKSTSKINKTH